VSKDYAILPCNGLDKLAGSLSREIALRIAEQTESEIICPTFYRVSDVLYNKVAAEKPLLVIDGCGTRCAGKLAAEKALKVAAKINVAEESKKYNIKLGSSLRLGENELRLCELVVNSILKDELEDKAGQELKETVVMPPEIDYEIYQKDKFVFRLPKEGFYFTENDCWAYVTGNKARIGVTDYVQKSLSDIMFYTPPALGSEIEQFGRQVFGQLVVVPLFFPSGDQIIALLPDHTVERRYFVGVVLKVGIHRDNHVSRGFLKGTVQCGRLTVITAELDCLHHLRFKA